MNIHGKEVTTTCDAAPGEYSWMVDEEWNDREAVPYPVEVLVATSSWQQLKTMHLDAKLRHIIAPSVQPVLVEEKIAATESINVCWAGDPSDGTLALLISVLKGIRSSVKTPIKFEALSSKEVSPIVMETVDKSFMNITKSTDKNRLHGLLRVSHIFAHPSMSWQSFSPEVATAMSAGCIPVVPKHSGFLETCSGVGFLSAHSMNNIAYGSAFASTLVEVMSLVQSESYDPFWRRSKALADWNYGAEKESFAWKELFGFRDFIVDNSI